MLIFGEMKKKLHVSINKKNLWNFNKQVFIKSNLTPVFTLHVTVGGLHYMLIVTNIQCTR